jgi:hypothetical protein
MRVAIVAAVLASTSTWVAATDVPVLPEGWRYPTPKELSTETLRNNSETKYARAVADFNGDGIPDQAFLVKSTKFSGEGLLLWLSDGPAKFKWVVLDTINWGPKYPSVPLAMGIDVIKPGVLEYICIVEKKGDCDSEEEGKQKMTLRRPALEHFKFESASSAFYWDTETRRFITIAISD